MIGLAAALIVVGGLLAGCTSGRSQSAASTDGARGGTAASAASIGDSTSSAPTTTAVATTTTVEETTTTTTEPPTTTTTIVVQGAIVKVANATKVPGGASKLTKLMADFGFQMAEPTDAAGNEEFRDTTQIYCLPGSEAVAGSIGILLDGVPVNYMPTPAPITDATAGLGDASVLVMLGKDLAGKTPPRLKNG